LKIENRKSKSKITTEKTELENRKSKTDMQILGLKKNLFNPLLDVASNKIAYRIDILHSLYVKIQIENRKKIDRNGKDDFEWN
jgi:hypothetical protein